MEFDLKLFKSACKDYLIDQASESKYLRENITISENERFNEWLKNLSDDQAFDIVCEKKYGAKVGWDIKRIRQLQNLWQKFMSYGLAAGGPVVAGGVTGGIVGGPVGIATGIAAGLTIAMFSPLFHYEFRKWLDPCYQTCRTQRSGGFGSPAKYDVYLRCRIRCGIKAADHVLSLIDKAKAKCSQVKDREKHKKCIETADKQKQRWLKKKAKLQKSKYAQWAPEPTRGTPT